MGLKSLSRTKSKKKTIKKRKDNQDGWGSKRRGAMIYCEVKV